MTHTAPKFEYTDDYDEMTATYGPFTITLRRDEYAENPLTAYDMMGAFIGTTERGHAYPKGASLSDYGIWENYGSFFRYTNAGNEIELDINDNDEIAAAITKYSGALAIPWSTRGYSQGDYLAGIWIVSHEELKKEYGTTKAGKLSPTARKRAAKYIEGQAAEFAAYLWGDVYGYEIEHTTTGKHVDSCGGHYGKKWAKEAAAEAAAEAATRPEYQADWEEPYAIGLEEAA